MQYSREVVIYTLCLPCDAVRIGVRFGTRQEDDEPIAINLWDIPGTLFSSATTSRNSDTVDALIPANSLCGASAMVVVVNEENTSAILDHVDGVRNIITYLETATKDFLTQLKSQCSPETRKVYMKSSTCGLNKFLGKTKPQERKVDALIKELDKYYEIPLIIAITGKGGSDKPLEHDARQRIQRFASIRNVPVVDVATFNDSSRNNLVHEIVYSAASTQTLFTLCSSDVFDDFLSALGFENQKAFLNALSDAQRRKITEISVVELLGIKTFLRSQTTSCQSEESSVNSNFSDPVRRTYKTSGKKWKNDSLSGARAEGSSTNTHRLEGNEYPIQKQNNTPGDSVTNTANNDSAQSSSPKHEQSARQRQQEHSNCELKSEIDETHKNDPSANISTISSLEIDSTAIGSAEKKGMTLNSERVQEQQEKTELSVTAFPEDTCLENDQEEKANDKEHEEEDEEEIDSSDDDFLREREDESRKCQPFLNPTGMSDKIADTEVTTCEQDTDESLELPGTAQS